MKWFKKKNSDNYFLCWSHISDCHKSLQKFQIFSLTLKVNTPFMIRKMQDKNIPLMRIFQSSKIVSLVSGPIFFYNLKV